MKTIIYKYVKGVIAFFLIAVVVMKIVDMHTDGTKIREGKYYIFSEYAYGTDRLVIDIPYGQELPATNVHLWALNYGESQQFYLKWIDDNKFCIAFGDDDLCLSIAEDGMNVELQKYAEKEEQIWQFEQVGHTQYYIIRSSKNDLCLYTVKPQEETYFNVVVYEQGEDTQRYYFTLKKV